MSSHANSTTEALYTGVEVAESVVTISNNLDIAKQALGAVGAVGEAVKPFVPLIGMVTFLVSEIIKVYENAQYNRKICNAFLDRVEAAQLSVKYLQRRKEENEKAFRDEIYYKNFVRFTDVLRKVKIFLEDVTQLHGYKKFLNANSVRERFEQLAKEFDSVMHDLQFTLTVTAQRQREIDQQSLQDDLKEMNQFLETIQGGILDTNKQIDSVLQEVLIIKNQMDSMDQKNVPLNENPIKAAHIESTDLEDPMYPKSSDRRGSKAPFIHRKILKKQGLIEVACKPITIPDEEVAPQEYQKAQALLAILGKLRKSDNILKFYGLSTIENTTVMILEWAEMGSLKDVYEQYDIGWRTKVEIALEICRGLTFLHSCQILHHDVRCENIMMDKNRKSKIAKFDYARHTNSATSDMKDMTTVVHWLAPEKLKYGPKQSYTFKCEIFSFGMLLWELAFERVPYEKWDMSKIREYVSAGGRENIQFGETDNETKQLQQEYSKIIVGAWQDDPLLRSSLQQIFFQLDGLNSVYPSPASETGLLPPKSIDFDGSLRQGKKPVSVSDEGGGSQFNELPKSDIIIQIIPLDEGIIAHKSKEYKKAWSCFQAHADLENPVAKYWKGYYLWEGYGGYKDKTLAAKLFKEAADESVADAQLRYAFSLVENKSKFNKEEFISYLRLAAENSNPTAQFNLGDLYLNGKLGVAKDQEHGIKYLKLAALNKHPKAIEVLKRMKIDIYNS